MVQNRYLCGNKLTLADIIIYNEIQQYMAVNGLDEKSGSI